jgi:hypothetical protein
VLEGREALACRHCLCDLRVASTWLARIDYVAEKSNLGISVARLRDGELPMSAYRPITKGVTFIRRKSQCASCGKELPYPFCCQLKPLFFHAMIMRDNGDARN